jgi:hypothetical protein
VFPGIDHLNLSDEGRDEILLAHLCKHYDIANKGERDQQRERAEVSVF